MYKAAKFGDWCSATTLDSFLSTSRGCQCSSVSKTTKSILSADMKCCIFVASLLINMHFGTSRSSQYAVDCPDRCDGNECKSTVRCKRTVLDDCGCCRVCAAAAGETCYRTVSGMDGVKCGPGLTCQFFTEEDDFGDEFGVCRGNQAIFILRSVIFLFTKCQQLNTND